MTPLERRLRDVRDRIAAACARAGRDPSTVRLVAVSKTIPADTVREAVAAGQTIFGENRVQEALAKMPEVGAPALWHLVGHLQRNKAKHAVGAFALIHSIDDVELARELDRRSAAAGIVQAVLVQANLAEEATKSGVSDAGVIPLLEVAASLPNLDLRGLMIVPPLVADPGESRPWFARLRALRDLGSSRIGRPLSELSMGMTDDFEVAIEEGATLVRVGRAIFGERENQGHSSL
jgi:pyridoxal phosphate enzyme (YggS family)